MRRTYNWHSTQPGVPQVFPLPDGGRQGGIVVQYRTFRNSDPPRLVNVWNEAFPGRGAVRLASSTPLERYVFAKPSFAPAGLFLAEEDECIGFAHAGLAPQ